MINIVGYDNLELIGQGGFAVVYRARQLSVGRDVAIKLLIDPTPDNDLIRRFSRESRAVGALSWHPHIAAVVDTGTSELDQAFIVFELLDGGSLEDIIEAGPLPWRAAVSAMIQISDAVEAAHRANVLHRDIKPANVLLDRLGVAKLGDFGIASMQDGTKTETGMLATTVAHAAPELFDGQPATAATDVYALGSTLHTLLAGTAPFEPPSSERVAVTIGRIASDPPPPLDETAVPPEVAAVIVHALAKQPDYRPRSAAAFGYALQQAQRVLGEPVTAMPVADADLSDNTGGPTSAAASATDSPVQAVGGARDGLVPVEAAQPSTRDVPLHPSVDVGGSAPIDVKPLGRTIAALAAVVAILVAGIGGVLLFDARRGPLATTAGGAQIADFTALEATILAGFPAANAIDGSDDTYWGITRAASGENIIGTTYVLKLDGSSLVREVGISNGAGSEFGRVAEVRWATSLAELTDGSAAVVVQDLEDRPGPQRVGFGHETDTIVLLISDLHDRGVANAGLAEILLVTE